jgi:4-hydroxybenzoate polyprenyltransferase
MIGPSTTGAPSLTAVMFDLSRGRQALLSVAQPALGALLALGRLPTLEVVLLGLVSATAGYLAVFSLNDVLDRHVDAIALQAGKAHVDGYDIDTVVERHPLARGDVSLRLSIIWVGCLAAISLAGAYMLAPACAALFVLAVSLEISYGALRRVTWLKTVISGLMVGVGGLAGWAAVAPLTLRALPFFGFLALWEIGGRNLPNDLSDIVADSAVGIRTVATTFGSGVSARATAAVAGATLLTVPALGLSWPATIVSVALGVWALGLPVVALVRRPTPQQAGAYFNRASLLPALVFVCAFVFMASRAFVGR